VPNARSHVVKHVPTCCIISATSWSRLNDERQIRSDNKVREHIAVKVLRTSFTNITVVAFKVLPLGSYAPMPVPSPPFKTILELVLWNGLQSCRCITPDVIKVIKMPSFQYFLYLRGQKKVTGWIGRVFPTQLFV